jgi:hypothetical protein
MKKKIVPRSDHEVYFLKAPEDLKEKQVRSFVAEQLDRLHPAFSISTVFDYKLFVFNKARWLMVTVMEESDIAEYRILYKGAALFTNTSIRANAKDFVSGGIKSIDDESIGFDTIKNCPVSLPLENEKTVDDQDLSGRLGKIPVSHGVFLKKTPKWLLSLAASAVILLISAFPLYYFLSNYKAEPLPVVEVQTEPSREIKYLPGAIEILARVSSGIAGAGGEISRWQYNENIESLLVIQLRAMDVLTAHEIFGEYDYVILQDIQNVSYIDGIPHITVNVKKEEEDYTVIAGATFPGQSSFIPVIIELNNAFRQNKITIVSETLPTSGNNSYVITYTANDSGLVSSLEIFTALCEKYSLKVSNIDITINDERQRFTVINTLSHRDDPAHIEKPFAIEMIPAAFGYRTPPPPVIRPVFRAPETAAAPATLPEPVVLPEPETAAVPEAVPEQPLPPAIGSISGGNRRVEFYRDPVDGKLKMREIND